MQRQFQKLALAVFSVTTGAVALVLISGAGAADAAARLRSGTRAHLLDSTTRIAPNSAGSPGLHLTGPNVMASVVGLMAVLAFAFVVVTFIRRRVRASAFSSSAAV